MWAQTCREIFGLHVVGAGERQELREARRFVARVAAVIARGEMIGVALDRAGITGDEIAEVVMDL